MTVTTRGDIANLIAMLKASFPNYHPERGTAEVFYLLLADLPKELLEAAVTACVTQSGRAFAPSVGEIRGMAGQLHVRVEGLPSPLDAFNEVLSMPADMIDRVLRSRQDQDGHTYVVVRRLEFSHPLVEKVARGLGWPADFPLGNPSIDRAVFSRAYEHELERAVRLATEVTAVAEYVAGESARLAAGQKTKNELIRMSRRGPRENGETPADQ